VAIKRQEVNKMLSCLTFLMVACLFVLQLPALVSAVKGAASTVVGFVKGLFTPKA